MEFSMINLLLTLGAGIASILSPCVLPVIPIIVTGRENESKFRPLFIVLGLSLTFIIMGVISSIAGGIIAGKLIFFEKFAGITVLIFGILMIADFNLFKSITFFNRFNRGEQKRGNIEGLILGASLGLVWIPCVGPMLSSVLATVASAGKITTGVILLSIYSLGFSIPMLIAAYSSQFFRKKMGALQSNPILLRILNGSVLVIFGIYILTKGLINFGY